VTPEDRRELDYLKSLHEESPFTGLSDRHKRWLIDRLEAEEAEEARLRVENERLRDEYESYKQDCTAIHEADNLREQESEARAEAAEAEVERWRQAVGLATTAVPDMVMDADHPIEMMHRVVAEVARLREPGAAGYSAAAMEVLAERQRQIVSEGWTAEHDADWRCNELIRAAACYLLPGLYPEHWPWAEKWWKPKGRRRNLVRAAALIIAELDRMERAGVRRWPDAPQEQAL